jgi:hypothetical protein
LDEANAEEEANLKQHYRNEFVGCNMKDGPAYACKAWFCPFFTLEQEIVVGDGLIPSATTYHTME